MQGSNLDSILVCAEQDNDTSREPPTDSNLVCAEQDNDTSREPPTDSNVPDGQDSDPEDEPDQEDQSEAAGPLEQMFLASGSQNESQDTIDEPSEAGTANPDFSIPSLDFNAVLDGEIALESDGEAGSVSVALAQLYEAIHGAIETLGGVELIQAAGATLALNPEVAAVLGEIASASVKAIGPL